MIGTKPSRGQTAAEVILSGAPFEGRPEVWDYVQPLYIDFGKMLENWPWSDGERIALNAAWACYSGGGGALLSDVLMRLDRDLYGRVFLAKQIAVGVKEAA